MDFPGLGTALNAATVVVGALLGILVGHRLPQRTRSVVTDVLGLVTLLMAGSSAVHVMDRSLSDAVGSGAMLVVLGALLIGGIVGSLLRIEERLAGLAGAIQHRLHARTGGDGGSAERERFIEGWLGATLLFCVGPLTILGSLDDGMGLGIDKLALKSVLDGFAALAFAASFGVGVLLSAVSVVVIQGGLTLAGIFLGDVMSAAQVSALTATGGLMLVGIALRLLDIKQVPVGDLLPALVAAPLLVALVTAF